ncbi:MAG: hypothetical protein ACRCXC_13535 [Legionella sp.]
MCYKTEEGELVILVGKSNSSDAQDISKYKKTTQVTPYDSELYKPISALEKQREFKRALKIYKQVEGKESSRNNACGII